MIEDASVDVMPLDRLRERAREAERLVAQARRVARGSFADGGPTDSAIRHVSALLDCAQKLLPGAPIVEDAPIATDLERARILAGVVSEAAALFAEISAGEARTPSPPAPPSRSTPARAP